LNADARTAEFLVNVDLLDEALADSDHAWI